jgi:hypothetical protein
MDRAVPDVSSLKADLSFPGNSHGNVLLEKAGKVKPVSFPTWDRHWMFNISQFHHCS